MSKIIVDFKQTIWSRVELEGDRIDAAKQDIISGKIENTTALWDSYGPNNISLEDIHATGQQMTLEENEGSCTIEVRDESGEEVVWTNAMEDEKKVTVENVSLYLIRAKINYDDAIKLLAKIANGEYSKHSLRKDILTSVK